MTIFDPNAFTRRALALVELHTTTTEFEWRAHWREHWGNVQRALVEMRETLVELYGSEIHFSWKVRTDGSGAGRLSFALAPSRVDKPDRGLNRFTVPLARLDEFPAAHAVEMQRKFIAEVEDLTLRVFGKVSPLLGI